MPKHKPFISTLKRARRFARHKRLAALTEPMTKEQLRNLATAAAPHKPRTIPAGKRSKHDAT